MRIAFFVQYCHTAGTYFRWHNLAVGLQYAGHTVDVYAGDFDYRNKKRTEIRDGVTYFISPSLKTVSVFSNPSDPFTAFKRVLELPHASYDVYHLFQPFLQAYIPWNTLRKRKQAKFIYDWDDLWTGGLFTKANNCRERYSQFVVKKLETTIPIRAHGVTVCSDFLKEKITDDVPVKKIYNGFWAKPIQDKTILRNKWGLKNNVFYLAYVGKTTGELSWIAEALKNIELRELDNIRLIIAGPSKELLEQSDLINHQKVLYLGELSSQDAAEICTASDLGLLPLENSAFNQSRFPIKFFDFLTAGTPIYYSGVGEIKNIGDNITGAFEGAFNKMQWAEGIVAIIRTLTDNPIVINTDSLSAEYSWQAQTKKLLHFYYEVEARKS